MSDTRLSVQPGWNSQHPRWRWGPMTEKFQARETAHHSYRDCHRFHMRGKNTTFNLLAKLDELRLREALLVTE